MPAASPESLPVGPLAVVAEVLRAHGQDGDALLRRFGLGQRALRDPLAPSAIVLHGRVLLAAIELSGLEHLPLLVGERARLDNVGPVRALALNAPTARAALQDLLHYAGIWYGGLHLSLEHDQGYAALAFGAAADFAGRDALLTAYLAGATQNLAQVFGGQWRPALVRVAQRRPADTGPYAAFFRAPVLFDQPRHEVLFAEADLDRPRGRSDPQLEAFLKKQLDALESAKPADLVGQVQVAIEGQLLRGECSNERIASLFGVHRHTLYRRLMAEGRSYDALLEDARRRLAQQMLRSTGMPLAEIASLLGYGTQGNFTRAFVRWFGEAPRSWRRRHQAASTFSGSRRGSRKLF